MKNLTLTLDDNFSIWFAGSFNHSDHYAIALHVPDAGIIRITFADEAAVFRFDSVFSLILDLANDQIARDFALR